MSLFVASLAQKILALSNLVLVTKDPHGTKENFARRRHARNFLTIMTIFLGDFFYFSGSNCASSTHLRRNREVTRPIFYTLYTLWCLQFLGSFTFSFLYELTVRPQIHISTYSRFQRFMEKERNTINHTISVVFRTALDKDRPTLALLQKFLKYNIITYT